jgi:ATP-binding cassette subfamily B protein
MLQAWLFLVYATILIRMFNMEELKTFLQTRKAKCTEILNMEEADIIFLSISKSKRFLFTRTACLEQSLAIFLLATSKGKFIDMVLGVKLAPFAAHAWVEIEGVPLHEEERVEIYKKILVI